MLPGFHGAGIATARGPPHCRHRHRAQGTAEQRGGMVKRRPGGYENRMADAGVEGLSRARILARLRAHRQTLAEEFGVAELALFGSVARGEPEAGSDVDLMVELSRPLGWDIVLLRDYLESLLGAPVDLVVRGGLVQREALWDRVSQELVYV